MSKNDEFKYESRSEMKQRRKKKKRKNVFLRVTLLILALIVLGFGGKIGLSYLKLVKNLPGEGGSEATIVSDIGKNPFSLLFMGVGSNGYDGEGDNADSIMLATINPLDGSAELVSVPRDNYLQRGSTCESAGLYDKVTHMGYSASCLESTLEPLFDLDINYYVAVNFVGFIDIVNALGGIEMNVPDLREGFNNFVGDASDGTYLPPELQNGEQWCEHNSNRDPYAVCFTEFGMQKVDGEQALALTRSRHYDSDFARSNRQTEVVKAILNKMLSPAGMLSINKVMDAVGKHVDTNIPQSQFLDFANLGKSLLSNKDDFAIRTSQLQGLCGTFDGDVYGRASYNRVPVKSIENIRKKIASNLDDTVQYFDEEELNFNIEEQSECAPYFGGDYLGDGYGVEDIQSFRKQQQ